MTSRGLPSLAARYAALLRGTGAAPALAASLVARLALGVTGLALLLLARQSTGSYATAGLVAAAYASSFAVLAPVRARRADRDGPRGVLIGCALLHPLVLVAVVLLAAAGVGAVPLAVAAVLAGATVPPVSGVMRALWSRLVPADGLTTAYSLEAVVIELCFLAGPALVAALTALSGPSAAVLTSGVLVLVGGLWLASTPACRAVPPHPAPGRRGPGPLSSPAVRSLLLNVGCVGAGFGAVEVAMPSFAEAHGAGPGTAGLLLAIWSAGSVLGGLVYGAVHLPARPERQLPWLVAALAVGATLPLLAGRPLVMALLLVLFGLTVAPFSTCNSILLGRAAPPGTATEAFTWSSSLIFGGAALGSAGGGWLAQHHGATAALVLTGLFGWAALATALGGRPALRA